MVRELRNRILGSKNFPEGAWPFTTMRFSGKIVPASLSPQVHQVEHLVHNGSLYCSYNLHANAHTENWNTISSVQLSLKLKFLKTSGAIWTPSNSLCIRQLQFVVLNLKLLQSVQKETKTIEITYG